MRPLVCVLAGLVAGAGALHAAHAAVWRATDMRQNLFSTCFISDQEGWTVGDLGRIFHTVDGAKTWEQEDAGTKRPFVGIACPGKNALWAAGQVGQIAHSKDGGKTWQMQPSGTQRQLLDVAFANPQRGVAVGDFGTIVRTDDGGATWTKIPFPHDVKLPPDVAEVVDPGDVLLYSATFLDAEHAWLAGEFGTILASRDGGLTWQQQTTPIESTLFGLFFADQQHGWAVGLDTALLQTADGGASWTKVNVEKPHGFSPALYDVRVNGNYGWVIGDNGLLLSSADAGATWQPVKVPIQMRSLWFRGLDLRPDGRGFIVGSAGMVLTTDRIAFTPLKQRY